MKSNRSIVAFVGVLLLLLISSAQGISSEKVSSIISELCNGGDLYKALTQFHSCEANAEALHSAAALEMILYGNAEQAVSLHKQGKSTDFTAIPPLAKLHLDGKDCAGLGDLFYVTAVIIKELVDSGIHNESLNRALKTLITLTSDSGLHEACDTLMNVAVTLYPADTSLRFRAAVLTPGVYDSIEHIQRTRKSLEQRVEYLVNTSDNLMLPGLDEFTLSPTFYFVYQGYNDKSILSRLQSSYTKSFPKLGAVMIPLSPPTPTPEQEHREGDRVVRVGFVSSHFRRHSICKLFCGVMTGLHNSYSSSSPSPGVEHAEAEAEEPTRRTRFEVFAFSSLQESREDKVTLGLRQQLGLNFVSIGMTFVQNRNEVVDRKIDILVRTFVLFEISLPVYMKCCFQ
jgi:hypothetical protein